MQQASRKRCKPTYILYKLKQQQDALIRKLVEKNETDTLISSTQGNSCHKKKDSNNSNKINKKQKNYCKEFTRVLT